MRLTCFAKPFALALALAAATAIHAGQVQVELQLVVHDQPTVTVDKLERSLPIARPVATAKGMEMQTLGVDVTCWARNVLLDGKPVFERYHDGKYIDRLPIARATLQHGDHTLWPGNHILTIGKDGVLSTQSPELLIEGTTVRIKCYPITLKAFRANPEEAGSSASLRDAPLPTLTIRESANAEAAGKKDAKVKVLELLPTFEKFAPLTIWLPGNSTAGCYAVHPLGFTFHLSQEGVKPVVDVEKTIPGLVVGKNSVEIPLYGFPVVADPGAKLIAADVEQINWKGRGRETEMTNWFPRSEPYELRAAENSAPIKIDGDPRRWPYKNFRIDNPDPAKSSVRLIAVEFEKRHFEPNASIAARVQVSDAARSATELLNLVKDARVSARVQAYESDEWTALTPALSDGGAMGLPLPALKDGLYRLELSVLPNGSTQALSVDRWVSVAAARTGGVGLFTQRGRRAFQRGEDFWLGVSATGLKDPLAAGTSIELDLVDANGKTLELLREKSAAAIQSGETFIARIESAQSLKLGAGVYRVIARMGSLASRELSITIVDPTQTTNFTNLITGKYNPQGDSYSKVIKSGEGADALARSIVEIGHNSFKGMSYDQNRVVRTAKDIEQAVRERPELGPWESYYQPSGRDRFLDAAVKYNLRFYEDIVTYHDTMLPRDPKILEATSRFAGLETASMRHSPAFKGVCLYDEIYSVADTGTPMSAHFLTAQEMVYRAKNPGLTGADAARALERFASRPFGQRKAEDLEKWKTWPAHEDSEWAALSQIMVKSVKAVMPESQNFTLQRFWGANGGNISPTGMSLDVFAPLDVAACVMYKDGGNGDRPVFAPMQADVLRVREGLPVWTQLHTFHAPGLYGEHLLRQAFFALSQKIDGITYFTLDADHLAPSTTDNRDPMNDIAKKLCTPYGDFFTKLNRGYKKVAIYYSREADYLGSKKVADLSNACEGLWVACMRAGFPADYLFDHDVRAGRAGDYDVIFAPGFAFEDETAPDILAALRKVVNGGKILAVDRTSKLPIEGVQRIDSDFDEYDDRQGGAFPRYIDFESDMVWDQSEETTKLVRAFLSKHTKPAAVHSLLVGPDWLKRGAGEYMIIPNFARTGFTFLHKTMFQAPDRPTLKFPKRPPVCYDVLEMKRVEVASDGDWMSLQADFSSCPGKVFAFLPSEIGRVELKASTQVQGGAALTYEVRVLNKAGEAIDAAFPLQIDISTEKGVQVQRIYRAAAPEYRGAFAVPTNLTSSTLKLNVRELVSGTCSEVSIAVGTGEAPRARLDTADVRISDDLLLKAFVSGKEPITIALDDEQAWCKAEAERLRTELEKRGRTVRVATSASIVRMPETWSTTSAVVDGTRLWRGNVVEPGLFVDSALILIGRRNDNRLIEALLHRDVLAEAISEHFPGRGRALLGCVYQAFSNQFNTVTILSNDADGLKKGVDALLAYDQQKPSHGARPVVVGVEPAKEAKLETASATASAPTSFAEALSSEDRIQSIDVDSSGKIVIGTFGYGQNLFCFAPDGKLVWKQFLPEHSVYSAQWYDDGKRIVASTAEGNYFFLIDGADGRVLKKMKCSEWPRFHYSEGAATTESQIVVNSALKQILVRGLTGILALDYDGKKVWHFDRVENIAGYPENAEQLYAASFGNSTSVGSISLSTDGKLIGYSESRIVGTTSVMNELKDLWGHRPMVIDAATGKVLMENSEDGGSSTGGGAWWMHFPKDSTVPLVGKGGFHRVLQSDGKLGPVTTDDEGTALNDGSRILSNVSYLARKKEGVEAWRRTDDKFWITALDQIHPAHARIARCSWDGVVRCTEIASGKTLWEFSLPSCALLRWSGEDLIVAGKNGTLARIDPAGKVAWRTRVREHKQLPTMDYAKYVAAALAREPDSSFEVYPTQSDKPGDYDAILRLGIEQLANGDFETDAEWKGESGGVAFNAPGATFALPSKDEGRALNLQAGQLVTQALNKRVMPNTTYLLEFMYRVEAPGAKLTAGAMTKGAKESFTASKFGGNAGEWLFGRLAVKTLDDVTALTVGFEAEGGAVRVDKASLKPVRFPSANLLANAELQQIEPTFVKDIRVRYNRIPTALRDKLRGRNHVSVYKQGDTSTAPAFSQEPGFLHNGRLDDVGSQWTYEPTSLGFSVTLNKPAYVSHVVLYLNNAMPEKTYSTMAVVANNMATGTAEPVAGKVAKVQGMPKLEALVRGNSRRFLVVHFPKAILTDSIKLLSGRYPGRQECLTEIELYGPLSGETGARAANSDPLATPMLMGTPSRVQAALPADVTGTYVALQQQRGPGPVFNAGTAMFDGLFAFGDPTGAIKSYRMLQTDPRTPPPPPEKGKQRQDRPERIEEGPTWTLQSVAPTTTPAHYAGRIFVGSADAKLHAVADNGAYLWAFKAGGRIYSSPLPSGDDVYFGCDDGKLYKIDVDSGALIWEFATGGRIRGAPALASGNVYVASGDGHLYAIAADSGLLVWKAPMAEHSRSTPAVKDGAIYIGDEKGDVHCFDLAKGTKRWSQTLGGYVSHCPVLSDDGAFFASEQGALIFVNKDGSEKWKRSAEARVTGQPMATQTQLLVPTERGVLVLRRSDGKDDERFVAPEKTGKVVGIGLHQSRLYMLTAAATTEFRHPPRTYANYNGGVLIWAPKPEAEVSK